MATDPHPFSALVPGFDFLKQFTAGAVGAMPSMGDWIAPTLDPDQLEKRIAELRTVQFWLEQNARLLGTTVQALEVQRMTLSTLRSMNVSMSGLAEAVAARVPASDGRANPVPSPSPSSGSAQAAPAAASVDPLQWWNALTRQFADIAAGAASEPVSPPAKTRSRAPAAPKRSRAAKA